MDSSFQNTTLFQKKMRPAALRVYRRIFPDCEVMDLRADGFKVHVLDKEFGIDSLIKLPSGQWLSLQEKYRRNNASKYEDFTQEYKNAVGTKYESDGEWFKLAAQVYFYGWANENETEFEKWVLIDIPQYKIIVEQSGGLKHMGVYRQNSTYGKASFFCIPIAKLDGAILKSHGIETYQGERDLIKSTIEMFANE
jgi:hypothetical protein|tara:strand:+ start:1232 stop:1816 length:585 start_codon:yes stop_codon:yes gene_type:complete